MTPAPETILAHANVLLCNFGMGTYHIVAMYVLDCHETFVRIIF